MSIFYGAGTHRIVYKAASFATGLTVTAYIWDDSLTKSALQTFTEVSDGLYYLDYAFAAEETYFGKFYEGGTGTTSASFRIVPSPISSAAAVKLGASAGTIVVGTVSHDETAASTTVFYSDDVTEATADHYNGRIIIFTSGDLAGQATDIVTYGLVSGEGKFTVTALTEAPDDNVTFVIV